MPDAAALDAYLGRLSVEPEAPSAEALFRLHRAHVERVPYETLWIQLGERWGIGASASFERIARQRRGGYCYHLNGAFSELLGALGYHVTRHVGGVHGPDGPEQDAMTNHLVLTVRDLPTGEHPDGVWYVDVGLGDALHEPLPLVAGTYDQGPFQLRLEQVSDGAGDWRLVHDPKGAFPGMAWRAGPARIEEFEHRHRHLSTSPDSGFVKVLTVLRRDATGVDLLRGLILRRIGAGAREVRLGSRPELDAALRDVFDLDLDPIGDEALGTLWTRVRAAQEAWEAKDRTPA